MRLDTGFGVTIEKLEGEEKITFELRNDLARMAFKLGEIRK